MSWCRFLLEGTVLLLEHMSATFLGLGLWEAMYIINTALDIAFPMSTHALSPTYRLFLAMGGGALVCVSLGLGHVV